MKVSELIENLREFSAVYGDCEIRTLVESDDRDYVYYWRILEKSYLNHCKDDGTLRIGA